MHRTSWSSKSSCWHHSARRPSPRRSRAGAEIYGRLRRELLHRGLSAGLGDEGGFAPELASPEEVLDLLVRAIKDAGYEAGRAGIAIALDPAANGFYSDGSVPHRR